MTGPAIMKLSDGSTPAEVAAYAEAELADFFETRLNPYAARRDEACEVIPRTVFEQAAEIGLLNYLIPAGAGGFGGGRRAFGLLLEQIGYLCSDPAFATMLSMYADVPNVIDRARRPVLLERYVRPMARGEKLGTFAYTDYGDAFDFRTRVVRDGDRHVVSGVKCLQTGGALADVFVVYARDETDDIRVLLVDRDDPGVSTTPVATLGLRSAGLTQLRLDGVVLDAERDLSGSDGLADAQIFLNSRRMFLVCPLVGMMKRIVETCVRQLDTVVREDRPLTQAQAVQARLGNMYAKYLTSRAILRDALDRIGRGEVNEMFDPVVSAAKFVITENVVDVGERAIRLTGWQGYATELPLQRMYRAAMAALTGQTAQDVLEINLGVVATSDVVLGDQAATNRCPNTRSIA
jgi:alkylation response protein AidB-like acyl-CoA dehydrogenase